MNKNFFRSITSMSEKRKEKEQIIWLLNLDVRYKLLPLNITCILTVCNVFHSWINFGNLERLISCNCERSIGCVAVKSPTGAFRIHGRPIN